MDPKFEIPNREQELIRELKQEFSRPASSEYEPLIRDIELIEYPDRSGVSSIHLEFGIHDFPEDLERKLKAGEQIQSQVVRFEFFKRLFSGAEFVDLGCGPEDVAWVPRLSAQALGARRYVGVDKYELHDYIKEKPVSDEALTVSIGPTRIDVEAQFVSAWVESDMLEFMSKMSTPQKRVFLIAGVEAYRYKPDTEELNRRYFYALWSEVARASLPGSAVLIEGIETWGESLYLSILEKAGFRKVRDKEIEKGPCLVAGVFIKE